MVLVTNGILGSINHTLLSLDAIESRGITLDTVIYNTYYDSDKVIAADTLGFIRRYLERRHPQTELLILPKL